MSKQKTNAIFIGRFQPFHNGHLSILKNAMKHDSIESVTVLVGSANKCRSVKNPFSFEERKDMIQQAISAYNQSHTDKIENIEIVPLNDHWYTPEKWFKQVRDIAGSNTKYIIGHDKDESSFYLKEFPEMELLTFDGHNGYGSMYKQTLGGTDIRNSIFEHGYSPELSYIQDLPIGTATYIKWWVQKENFRILREEYKGFQNEDLLFKTYPFPNSLNCCTADSVVVCCGHILLITRKAAPGKGLLALPGGHKDSNERFLTCAVRELLEETRIKVPEKVLYGSLKDKELFDYPYRSQNLCKPTMAYYFHLFPDFDGKLPKVKPADDALEAKWYPLSEIAGRQTELFDDHMEIIQHFTGI